MSALETVHVKKKLKYTVKDSKDEVLMEYEIHTVPVYPSPKEKSTPSQIKHLVLQGYRHDFITAFCTESKKFHESPTYLVCLAVTVSEIISRFVGKNTE